jgi:hypothetical protein
MLPFLQKFQYFGGANHSIVRLPSDPQWVEKCKTRCISDPNCTGFFERTVVRECPEPESSDGNTHPGTQPGKGCMRSCGFYTSDLQDATPVSQEGVVGSLWVKQRPDEKIWMTGDEVAQTILRSIDDAIDASSKIPPSQKDAVRKHFKQTALQKLIGDSNTNSIAISKKQLDAQTKTVGNFFRRTISCKSFLSALARLQKSMNTTTREHEHPPFLTAASQMD